MGTLLELGLTNALMAAGLALVAVLAGKVYRRPALMHALWLLVLIKLLLPPYYRWPVALLAPEAPVATAFEYPGPAWSMAVGDETTPILVNAILDHPPRSSDVAAVVLPPLSLVVEPAKVGPTPPGDAARDSLFAGAWPAWNLQTLLFAFGFVWLTGSVAWFALAALRLGRFQRLLRCAKPAPESLQEQAQRMANRLELGRCPRVWLVPGRIAPLVWAAGGRARIFFPSELLERLDDFGRAALLVHELAHVKRRDHWVRWLELTVVGLYWWYPLVWWARRQMQAAEEECCDAWVVGELPGTAKTYATALLDTLEFLAEGRLVLPPAASGMGRMHDLHRRLNLIMSVRPPRRLSPAGWLFVLVAAALSLQAPTLARQTADIAPPAEPAPLIEPPAPAATQQQSLASVVVEEPPIFTSRPVQLMQTGTGEVWAVAASPDGGKLAVVTGGVGDTPGELRVWDIASRQLLYRVQEPQPIRCVAFAPDGKRLAVGGFDHTVKLRETATGRLLQTLYGHGDKVNGVAFSPDGQTLATVSLDRTVRLWDANSGLSVAVLTGHANWVLGVAWSPDGQTLATASKDRTARLWDVANRRERLILAGHVSGVEQVAFTPDGNLLVTAGWDKTVRAWDTADGRLRAVLPGQEEAILGVAFAPDGRRLATSSASGLILLWDVATWQVQAELEGHGSAVYSVAFTPDGHLVSGGWDRTARLWDAAGQEAAVLSTADDGIDTILSLTFTRDGKLLAAAGCDDGIALFDAMTGAELRTLDGLSEKVEVVALTANGRTLASAGKNGTICLWDTTTGQRIDLLRRHATSVRTLLFSPDGKQLAIAGADATVRLWDTVTCKQTLCLRGPTASVRALAWSADGRTLAAAAEDGNVLLWDLLDGTIRLRLMDEPCGALAFAPQGNLLALGGMDGTIRLWDSATAKRRAMLVGHGDSVTSLVFAPDGKQLASGSADKTVKLWVAGAAPREQRHFALNARMAAAVRAKRE